MLTGKYYFKHSIFGSHSLMVEETKTTNDTFYRKAKQEDVKWLWNNNFIEKPSRKYSYWKGYERRPHEITGDFYFQRKFFGGLKLKIEYYNSFSDEKKYWKTATNAQTNHFELNNGL